MILVWCCVTGCTAKLPWGDPLAPPEYTSAAALVDSAAARDRRCAPTIGADLALSYQSPLTRKSIQGSFLFSFPSSFKFVVTNPFGQPVWAVAGDRHEYRILDTANSQYTWGNVKSFGTRNGIAPFLVTGDWGQWLTARALFPEMAPLDIREDTEKRGYWVATRQHSTPVVVTRSLVSGESGLIQTRIVETGEGKKLAQIHYSKFQQLGGCYQPQEIEITGLGYKTLLKLHLSEMELYPEPATYSLPSPPYYFKRLLP